jgi:hypothetical protein
LEIKSNKFQKTTLEVLNHDKIANILFLILKMPVLGYEKGKIYPIVKKLGDKTATLENLEKLERFFNYFFPNEILDSDAAIQTILDQTGNGNLGRHISPNEIRKSIRSPNLMILDAPKFSFFNYATREMSLFLAEQFQFSLSKEESQFVDANVISDNNEKFGTKWDAYGANVNCYDDLTTIDFSTAWSPPIPVIENISEMFPDADIKLVYAEQGAAYCGQIEFENGNFIDHMDSEFSFKLEYDDEDESFEDNYEDLANWQYDRDIELELLGGRFGG